VVCENMDTVNTVTRQQEIVCGVENMDTVNTMPRQREIVCGV